MGSRLMGELLLRPTSLAHRSLIRSPSSIRPNTLSWTPARPISNTSSSAQAAPPPPKVNRQQDDASQPQNSTSAKDVSDSIEALFSSMPNTRYQQRPATRTRSLNPSSATELKSAREAFGANFSDPSSRAAKRHTPLNIDALNMDSFLGKMPEETAPAPIPESEKIYPRLGPAYGRTIELDDLKGRDMVRGIQMLGAMISRNNVRVDVRSQKFHERPGLKRKRLNIQRWRKRFDKGFKQVTARVTELTRKGW